jgi:hypothetical protein
MMAPSSGSFPSLPRFAACVFLAAGAFSSLRAQAREVQTYGPNDPEGKLILYYSSAMAFSGISDGAARKSALDIGFELSYVPPLTEEQRSVSNDKTESTNLAPVLPRPRVSYVTRGDFRVEASWLPPVKVFGVKANILAASLSHELFDIGSARVVGRLAGMTGIVKGPITCNEDFPKKGFDNQEYYRKVCYSNESEDHFKPRHVMGELIVSPVPSERPGRFRPYLGAGARWEHTEFDIGVQKPVTSGGKTVLVRDTDHPILELQGTRPYGVMGTSFRARSVVTLAGELYYMPGSLFTVRTMATYHLR